MKRLALAIVFVGVVLTAGARPGAEEPNQVDDFMKQKLHHAQKVLEGLATQDFDMIRSSAGRLKQISQEANWRVLQTPAYLQHSVEFRRTTDALVSAAKQRNVDGASLAYVDMTMKCINCHKHVRDVRMAAVPQLKLLERVAER